MTIKDVSNCLLDYTKANTDQDESNDLNIPIRTDGSEYSIQNLQQDQKQAMAVVIQHIKEYCDGALEEQKITMRLTVAGVAGSGKSTWINTLVTVVRRLFKCNDAIGVFGPTGSAAFNAGGETINRGFRVPIPVTNLEIGATKEAYLFKRYARTIAIVIDERSMVEAEKLGCVKHYMNECAHNGGTNLPWGGIPVVILVGDDYQLPPIGYGAFYALDKIVVSVKLVPKAGTTECRIAGYDEFKSFAANTVYLESMKRVNEDQEQLRRILKALRCEDVNTSLDDVDVQRMLELDIRHHKYTRKEREEIQASSMYLFANKEPCEDLNENMLLKANQQGNPVARMQSITTDKHGSRVSNNAHFDGDRCPTVVMLCKTAKVSLNGQNISPNLGLYHGSIGIIEDIVYLDGQKPHHGELPAYVLVNFAQYCGKQLMPHSRQSVPIPPMTTRCKYGCCTRSYMPLSLAYAKTIHTFQGQTVGPAPPGRPENPIKRIIVDPGDRKFEGNNIGLFYTALSRATTIGNTKDKMSSAIYFHGQHYSKERITNLTIGKNGRMYHKAELRQKWVKFMKDRNENRKHYTKDEMTKLFDWIMNKKFNSTDLTQIVMTYRKKDNVLAEISKT